MKSIWTLSAIVINDWGAHGDYKFYTDMPTAKACIIRTEAKVMAVLGPPERLQAFADELKTMEIHYISKWMDQHYNIEWR